MIVAASGSPLGRAGRALLALGVLALVWATWSRSPRWWRALGVLVGGILGTVCGIALGVIGVVKSGAAVPTLGGLLALTGGLVLLVVSLVRLLHALHGPWKLAALVVSYLVAQLAILPLTVGVYAANPPAGHVSSTALRVSGLVARAVSFRSSDGVTLAGWYAPSHNGAGIVVVPGSGSTRASVLSQGAVLAHHGYGVLLVDNRGHGESGGSAMDFGWWGERDLAGAVTFLAHRPEVDRGRIAILGESMGGEEAIGAIGADKRVRAVVAEGVTGRSAGDFVASGTAPTTLIEHFDTS